MKIKFLPVRKYLFDRGLYLLWLCGFLFFLVPVMAGDSPRYFISPTGNDNHKGTRAKPFKTIEKINRIQLQPGSELYFQGGAVFEGTLILDADENGTTSKPIVITSYGKGMATIDGSDKEAIVINSNYFRLHNIHAKGLGRKEGNHTNGILIKSAHSGEIRNVITEGFQKSGIELNNTSDMRILKVIASNNGFCGINVSGVKTVSKNILIKDCKADNNAGDPTVFDNHSGNGILVGGSDSVLIDHCTATNNGWDMPRKGNGPVGIWGFESDHLVIQYCISYRNRTQAGASDGGGFDFDGGMTNSTIQYCLSYENQGSGYGIFQYEGAEKWSGNTVRYCVSINDGQTTSGAAGFLIWNSSTKKDDFSNCRIYNNVTYNEKAPAVRFDTSSVNNNFVFANNIFMGKNDLVSGISSGETFIGNVWWNIPGYAISFRGYKTLAEWSAATGQEKWNGAVKGMQADPSFAGPLLTDITDPYKLHSLKGYKLAPGSPIRGKGLDLASYYNIIIPPEDFYGNTIKSKTPEPGIHELNDH